MDAGGSSNDADYHDLWQNDLKLNIGGSDVEAGVRKVLPVLI